MREKHLAAAMRAALARRFGAWAITGRVVPIPGWPSLGRSGVELLVESAPRSYR